MATPAQVNDDRITARVPKRVKATMEKAAAIQGTNLNQFMLQASLQAARAIIEQEQAFIQREQAIRLSTKDVRRFFEGIDNPPEPTDKLKRSVERHRRLFKRA